MTIVRQPLLIFSFFLCVQVSLIRKLNFVSTLLDELRDFRARKQQEMLFDGAEIYIAKAYRTLVFRRKLKKLITTHHEKCALLIQRIYKGHRVRKKFHLI